MTRPFKHIALGMLALTALLLVGCANPYLKGFTGEPGTPLAEDAPVEVFGANRGDAAQMDRFEAELSQARARHTELGNSTIVSAGSLRDETAAEAGRELGATLVLYSFGYVTSTVETDRTTRHHTYDHDNHRHHGHSYDTTSTTKHWYEYRAYFFRTGG